MKKLAFLLGVSFLILLIGQAKAYNIDRYYFRTSSASDFNMTAYTNVTANASVGGYCNTEVNAYYDINASTTWSYQFSLYIDGILNFTNTQTSSGSKNCFPLGNMNMTGGFHNTSLRAVSLGGAVPVTIYIETHVSCFSNDSFIQIYDSLAADMVGYNMYQDYNVNSSEANFTNISYWWETSPNTVPRHCVAQFSNSRKESAKYGGNIQNGNASNYYVPFNSGSGNIIRFVWQNPTGCQSIAYGGYYDPDTNITTQLVTMGAATINSSNISLSAQHEYIMWLSWVNTLNPCAVAPPMMTIDVLDYEPSYSCGAWGICTGNIQTRTCTDTKGGSPDIIQTRSCLLVNQTAILGFENFYIPADRWICQPIWYPLCGIAGYEGFGALANVTVLYPDNPRWTIVPNTPLYYIGTITSETATLGSRSLKLWYIPQSPYNDQPTNVNGTTLCQNTTFGTFPEIFRVINTSFMASLDFTFPAGTTELRFDVKRCDDNAIQYNNWCGKRCYAQNCTIPPSGDFVASLYDQATGTNLFQLTKEAATSWTTYTAFIGSNAILDRNYTLAFSVLPLPINPTETQGNCVYFDNVRLINTQHSQMDDYCDEVYGKPCNELTDAEIQTVLIEKCVSQCIGNDYYTRIIQDLTCIETITLNESTCVTQHQQQQIGNQSIFIPISSIANTIVNTTTNQTLAQSMTAGGYGFVLVFLTPIFWIFLIIIVVMSIVSLYTKHMEIGGVSGLLLLVAFAVYFPELVWITIIIIIISGFLIGRQIVRAVQGG